MVVRCGDVDMNSLGTQRCLLGTLSASTSWPNGFRRQQVGQARPPTRRVRCVSTMLRDGEAGKVTR